MKKNVYPLLILYVGVIFILLLASVLILMNALRQERAEGDEKISEEPIYVYLEKDTLDTDEESLPPLLGYYAREYRDKIGIFYVDGSLYQVLDTYVKTLPEADRSLLREGIYLEDEKALRGLIEDYT